MVKRNGESAATIQKKIRRNGPIHCSIAPNNTKANSEIGGRREVEAAYCSALHG